MLDYIVNNFLLIYLLEVGAAVSGSYYLRKVSASKPAERLFVKYLWVVVFVEIIGLYPTYNYFDDFTTFPFFEGSRFERNYWWYNLYNIFKFAVFYFYFISQISNIKSKKILKFLAIFFLFSFVVNLLLSGNFFEAYSVYNNMAGTFFLMILIFYYFFELLTSEKILEFRRDISFYIAVGLLVWHVTVTPLFIYSRFFSMSSPDFVSLHSLTLKLANIFLYGLLIAGFLICSRTKLPVSPNFRNKEGVY